MAEKRCQLLEGSLGLEVEGRGVENWSMAQGRASESTDVDEHRPREDTANWALAVTAGWSVLAVARQDASYLFPAAMCFAIWLQCHQRIVVEGRFVRRVGLRPVVIDIGSATVVHTGSSWWRELFLCGPALQLRDAEGHRLFLESWLWDAQTRDRFVEAAARAARS